MNQISHLYEELINEGITSKNDLIKGKLVRGHKDNIIVCKDDDNNPFILLKNLKEEEGIRSYNLQNLKIEHQQFCNVHFENDVVSGNFSIVSLTKDDEDLRLLFFDTLDLILKKISVPIKSNELDKLLDQLVQLFTFLKKKPIKTASGLWAELYLIYQSKDKCKSVQYWHKNPDKLYDFSLENNHIEIKSTLSDRRKHFFSIYQAYPNGEPEVLIASVLLDRKEDGVSVIDLKNKIKSLLGDEIQFIKKLDRTFYETLGDSWKESSKEAFDISYARENMAFFNLRDIPKLDAEQKDIRGISEISFRSDLSYAEKINNSEYKNKSDLFKNLLNL